MAENHVALLLTPEGWELLSSLPPYDPSEALSLGRSLREEGHSPALVAAALTQQRLRERAHQRAGTMSGGEQQRIGILRAIAAKPDILLMDEPFSALDPLARASLQETVSLIHKKLGTTIVFVTHDMNEAAKLACRIGVMQQGRLVQVDTPQDIQNHPADDYVRSLFGAAQSENTASADEVINLYRRLDADGKARVREHWAKEGSEEN